MKRIGTKGYIFGRFRLHCILAACPILMTPAVQGQGAQPMQDPAELYQLAEALYNKNNPTEANDSQAVALYTRVGAHIQAAPAMRMESLLKAGNILMKRQWYDSCNQYYHQVLYLNELTLRKAQYNYQGWLFLGTSLYYSSTLDSARYYFEKAAVLAEKYKQKINLQDQDRLYNSLGALYFEAANYQQAKNHFVTALSNVSPRAKNEQELYTTIQSNIANCLLKLKQYDSAIAIFQSLKPLPAQKQAVLQNLANAFFEKGNLSAAQDLYQSLQAGQVPLSAAALNNLARIYTAARRWSDAHATLQTALQQNASSGSTLHNKERALTYLYMGELSQKMGLPEEAIDYCNKALATVFYNFVPKAKGALPDDVTHCAAPLTGFQVLLAKARLQLQRYRNYPGIATLQQAHHTYQKAVELLNYITLNLDNDDARIFFLENAASLFDEAIRVAYLLCREDKKYRVDYVFVLESYKGSLLKNNLVQLELKATQKLPEPLLQKEQNLKELYAVYLTRLANAMDEGSRQKLQDRISAIQVELAQLQRSMRGILQNKNPHKGQPRFSLAGFQKKIPAGTAVVNYYVGQSGIYILALSGTDIALKQITMGGAFQEAWKVLTKAHALPLQGERYNGNEAAYLLYKQLLAPVEEVIKSARHLVIIPDDFLYQLSFEALHTGPEPRQYLLLRQSCSYHYSMQLLLNAPAPHTGPYATSVLAMAPFAGYNYIQSGRDAFQTGLPALPFTTREVQQAWATTLLDSAATKSAFLRHYARYQVLHLATHANLGADSNTNWIQFFPKNTAADMVGNRLYVQEIYNLNLGHKPLVLLSACEGANGQMASGEGLLSLSRAFLYAGAGGVISTLYKTDDFVAAIIIDRLYEYLQKGVPPMEALRKAKIDFLMADTISPRLKNPAYWSNFIFTGCVAQAGPSPVAVPILWGAVCVLALLGLVFLVLHFTRQSNT